MKHVPKKIEGDENISKSHPLKDFSYYLAAVLVFCLFGYAAISQSVDLIANSLPFSYEQKIHKVFKEHIDLAPESTLKPSPALQALFNKVISKTRYESKNFELLVTKGENENAFALPGGIVVVVDEVLKNVKSENELAFILAHELGHYEYRHHIKKIGRALISLVASIAMSNSEANVSDQVTNIMSLSDLAFGREQEEQADMFALYVVNQIYGHVNGAMSFFERNKDANKFGLKYLSTHPQSDERIKSLEKYLNDNHIKRQGKLTPWQN